MPFYKFYIVTKPNQAIQFIRQLDQKDLDVVWRQYERKAKDHYKSKLISFEVVHLSKLSPEVKKWIADQGKPETKLMDDLLNDQGVGGKVASRKKGRNEGPALEERK